LTPRRFAHRIAHLVEEQGVAPGRIMAVTFTNKAARELRDRVESLLGGLAPGAKVARRERRPRNEVSGSGTEPLERATILWGPRLVVERGMREQRARGRGRGKGRCRLVFTQTSICFRLEFGRRGQIDPVRMQRVARIAVADPRSAEDTAQPAHDHRQLRRWVAGLIIEPEDVGQSLDAHRASLRDTEHPERQPRLAAAELMLCKPLDREPVDDADSHGVRRRDRAHRRRRLGADHGT